MTSKKAKQAAVPAVANSAPPAAPAPAQARQQPHEGGSYTRAVSGALVPNQNQPSQEKT